MAKKGDFLLQIPYSLKFIKYNLKVCVIAMLYCLVKKSIHT